MEIMATRISEEHGRDKLRVIIVIGKKKVLMTAKGGPDSQGSMKMAH